MVLVHLQKFQTKKTLKCHLELNFYNFQKKKNLIKKNKKKKKEKITIDYYNILTVGITIIESYVNTISDLGFTIILYLCPLYNVLKGDY